MYHSLYGPNAPVDLAGTASLTAAQELRLYRNYLIAAKAAEKAAVTQAQKDYAQSLYATADSYKRMYLSRGDADLSALDKIVLSVGDTASGIGSTILRTVGPLLLGAVAINAFIQRRK